MTDEERQALKQNIVDSIQSLDVWRQEDVERGGVRAHLQCTKRELEFLLSLMVNNREWIPVSERLPKIADVYRVTRYYPNNVMNPKYLVDACAFDGSNTWYNDNRINHERSYADNVIAWQENPEPYNAEKDSEI